MAESWEDLPDVAPAQASWEDLPDVATGGPPQSRGGFLDYLKAKFSGEADAVPDVSSLPGVRAVQTPGGPTHLDAAGNPVLTPQEAEQMQAASASRFRQRVLEGGLSVLSGGGTMADEMAGAGAMLNPNVRGSQMGSTYRQARDSTRRDVESATRNASPTVSVGEAEIPVLPLLGAAIPSMMAPLPLGAFGRILSGGTTAAIDQLGRSEVDLAAAPLDNLDEFATDVAKSGALGLGVSGLAEGLSLPARAIGNGATRRAAEAAAAAEAANAKVAEKALKSATGTMGGVATGGMHSIGEMEKILANPSGYSPAVVAEAKALRALPETQKAIDRAAMGNLDKFKRFMPEMDAAELARTEAAATAAPSTVAAKTAGQLDPSRAMSDWGGRAWESVGQRAAMGTAGGLVGAGVAEATGNDAWKGLMVGAGSGWATPGVLQFARNTAKSPVMQNMAARGLSGAADLASGIIERGGRTGAVMSAVEPTPESTQKAQENAFQLLAKRFGINAKSREELANEAFVRSQTP